MIFEASSDVSLERLVLAFLVRFPAWFHLSFRFSFEAFEKGANAWYTVKIIVFHVFQVSPRSLREDGGSTNTSKSVAIRSLKIKLC